MGQLLHNSSVNMRALLILFGLLALVAADGFHRGGRAGHGHGRSLAHGRSGRNHRQQNRVGRRNNRFQLGRRGRQEQEAAAAYGAPAEESYGAPADDAYGAPAEESYGAPANDDYGAEGSADYDYAEGSAAADSYGAPAEESYGAPADDPYGAP